MKNCPNCFRMVPDDHRTCPFCSESIEGSTPGVATDEWRIIRTVTTEYEARFIAGRLISCGIPACVLSQIDSTRNLTVGALAIAKVFVPEEAVEEAERILDSDAQDGLPEADDDITIEP